MPPDPLEIWNDSVERQRLPRLTANATLTSKPGSTLNLRSALMDKADGRHLIARVDQGGGREGQQLLILPWRNGGYRKWWYDGSKVRLEGVPLTWSTLLGTAVPEFALVPFVYEPALHAEPTYLGDETLDGVRCNVVEVRWRHRGDDWPDNLRLWLTQADHLERKIEQYRDGEVEVTVTFPRWRSHGARDFALHRTFQWTDRENTRSDFEFGNVDPPATPLDEDVFKPQLMGQPGQPKW